MFGYYDKHQVDETNTRVLLGKIPFYNQEPTPQDEMEIGWVQYNNKSPSDNPAVPVFHPIASTSAWNLQQGCMMEWISPTSVIFNTRNSYEENVFSAQIYETNDNFLSWTLKKVFSRPVYAWSGVRNQFVSLSFARLHHLRKGYGYTTGPYDLAKVPLDDGLWMVDIDSEVEEMMFSYASLRQFILDTGMNDTYTGKHHLDKAPMGDEYYWWANHVMWSSDGTKLSFIVRAASKEHNSRQFGHMYHFSALVMMDIPTKKLWRVPGLRGSHPFHHATLLNCEGKGSFDIGFQHHVTQLPWQKGVDGHCSKHPSLDRFVTDTYPRPKKDLLIVDNEVDSRKISLGKFLPGSEGPVHTRCDLHPKWSRKGDYVLFDSTHVGKQRAVYAIPIKLTRENEGEPDYKMIMRKTEMPVPQQEPKPFPTCKKIFLDLGANIGMHSRFIFEPQKYPSSNKKKGSDRNVYIPRQVLGSSSYQESAIRVIRYLCFWI
uniref:Uncharacterized protein n=1 Tax=Entomoneis paludosa TaxID=265537 RepID=A0A7S2YI69_9STRA|mmetsp:Transcript_3374/g.6996  ORF Transcript_3374/g.6996 Transcript_3374/m.6996 type:complete len:486 (+) Transcript_3374:1310-2767(+)